MFRRREQRTFTQRLSEAVYPRGGWKRAVMYMQYRVRRLPDSSDRIARGIAVGVMATFTPFYGMHFLVAFILARIVGGNVFAGLAATFVGNPITFPFIGFLCMKLGHLLMGTKFDKEAQRTFMHSFVDAWHDLKENIWALFSGGTYDWHGFLEFYHEVFLPYLVGGILPGLFFGVLAYFCTEPLVRAYQNRRRMIIRSKFDAIKARAAIGSVAGPGGLGRRGDRGKEQV